LQPRLQSPQRAASRCRRGPAVLEMEGGGMFGNMWEKAMLKLVEVKEKDGAKKKLQVPFPLPHHPFELQNACT